MTVGELQEKARASGPVMSEAEHKEYQQLKRQVEEETIAQKLILSLSTPFLF